MATHPSTIQLSNGCEITAQRQPRIRLPGLSAVVCAVLMATVARAEDPPKFVTLFGRPASASDHGGPAELWCPFDIDADSAGNVYVVDGHYDRVVKFSRFGTYLGAFGSFGSGNGQFEVPTAVAVGPGDEIFVVDSKNFRVQVFDSAGNYVRQFGSFGFDPGEFSTSFGIDVDDATGTVFVADVGSRYIHKFDVAGTFLGRWSWVDPVAGVPFRPQNVAVHPSGDVFVLDSVVGYSSHYAINRFTSGGALIAQWGDYGTDDGEFSNPWGVAIDDADDLYVTDYSNENVQKFHADGTFVWKTDDTRRPGYTTLIYPTGVLVNDGVLYTLEYTSDGKVVQLWGDAPFSMAVDVPTLAAGDLFTLRSFAGGPANPAALFITAVNGSPVTLFVAAGTLDDDAHWTLEATVPSDPGLAGTTLDLMTYSLDARQKVVSTNSVVVVFQ